MRKARLLRLTVFSFSKVHLASTIKIVRRGGGLVRLIDSGLLARQSRRTQGPGARQTGPNRACFSCMQDWHGSKLSRQTFPLVPAFLSLTESKKKISDM